MTADYVWGPEEAHYDEHRYIMSAYILGDDRYYLEDRYMTVRKYDLETADILTSEKQEILARLNRIKAANKKARVSPARDASPSLPKQFN